MEASIVAVVGTLILLVGGVTYSVYKFKRRLKPLNEPSDEEDEENQAL